MRGVYIALVIISWQLLSQGASANPQNNGRPNIVMVVVDDMRFDEFGLGDHSFLETPHIDQLARDGVSFSRAYHATPLCSPNRASLLTGQYASRHGVIDNTSRSQLSHRLELIAGLLQSSGYRTGHIGKWHMGNDPTPRPGYDYWVSFAGHGEIIDPELYEAGELKPVQGYVTDILTERALQFINNSAQYPFFLYIGHKAIHPEARQNDDGSADMSVAREFIPAARHDGRYKSAVTPPVRDLQRYRSSEHSRPLKESLSIRKGLTETNKFWRDWVHSGFAQDTIRKRAEMMLSVDEGLGIIVQALKKKALFDNTLIIFTSDNGYFFGEHGLTIERRYPYEESVRAPLIIKKPKTDKNIKPNVLENMLVASVDLAPTILEYANVTIPVSVQGQSLFKALEGSEEFVRDAVYIEYFAHEKPFPWTAKADYRAIILGTYKLITWTKYNQEYELYDLEADPKEVNDLSNNREYEHTLALMLDRLRHESLTALGLD